jgi:hypothetical protein
MSSSSCSISTRISAVRCAESAGCVGQVTPSRTGPHLAACGCDTGPVSSCADTATEDGITALCLALCKDDGGVLLASSGELNSDRCSTGTYIPGTTGLEPLQSQFQVATPAPGETFQVPIRISWNPVSASPFVSCTGEGTGSGWHRAFSPSDFTYDSNSATVVATVFNLFGVITFGDYVFTCTDTNGFVDTVTTSTVPL